jgi:hypothetical protein
LKPTVLVATTSRWFPTARLAVALAKVGCVVEAVCPPGHPIGRISAVARTHSYKGLAPLKSIAAAIAATEPDLIVSGDDLATWHLHCLYDRELSRGDSGSTFRALIERSFGAAEYFPVVDARAKFIEAAKAQGIRVPETAVVQDIDSLKNWITRGGVPVVLKADGTSGGEGVRIVTSMAESARALRELQAPPLIARAAKRALLDRDRRLVWPALLRQRSIVNAQSFVNGREATSAVACWNGTVLASLHFEVLQKGHLSGHATVLRRIDHPEINAAAEKIVRCLKLSGLHGFDFMLEESSHHAYLIEINPRATQVCHLSFGPGHDLAAALISVLTGKDIAAAPKVTENDTVALFPQEWLRDPSSNFLHSGYHDVPWDEPGLLRACLKQRSGRNLRKLAQRYQRRP